MKTLSRDNDNNLILKGNGLVVEDGLESVKQRLSNAIFMNKGDNFLDYSEGISYLNPMLKSEFVAELRKIILSVPDVIGINKLDVKKENDKIVIELNVESNYGRIGL